MTKEGNFGLNILHENECLNYANSVSGIIKIIHLIAERNTVVGIYIIFYYDVVFFFFFPGQLLSITVAEEVQHIYSPFIPICDQRFKGFKRCC